ncbi:MAG TPA: lysylphosphatidylglycerol synthase domain-containing protein [Nitrococcus sp.]|nr:lysylphosphatidylglycerol synthase domain-containing protein [Nitrococcus sp.]
MTSARSRLRRLLHPKVLIPLLLSLALLAAAFSLTDFSAVFDRGVHIPWQTLLLVLALAGLYLALKGWQFARMLRAIGLQPPWRALLLAFSVGEMTLSLPFGVYSQNYVLQRATGTPAARSTTVTTMMLVFELGVALAVLAFCGIPGWPELRPIALCILILGSIGFGAFHRSQRLVILAVGLLPGDEHSRIRQISRTFLERLKALPALRIAVPNLLITLFYLLVLAFAFYLLGQRVSDSELLFVQSLTVYVFALLVALLIGSLLSQIGVIEMAGLGAAKAWGIAPTDGLSMLLWFRLVWTASIWLICAPLAFLLRSALDDSH